MINKKIIAGNWKMYKTKEEAQDYAKELKNYLKISKNNSELILFPPVIHIDLLSKELKETSVKIGAQNCYHKEEGAYTGAISAKILKSFGLDYVLIGHSERRKYFKESNNLLAKKIEIALKNNLTPIFCCGEDLETRLKKNQRKFVGAQLEESLFNLSKEEFKSIIIAYEPIWAIGTGATAKPEDAILMNNFIKSKITERYDLKTARNTKILYGGSVKPENSNSFLHKKEIDGVLVGGASLNAKLFLQIGEKLK